MNSMQLTAGKGFLLTADWSGNFVFPHHSKNAFLENKICSVSWLFAFLSILLVCPIGNSQFRTRLCHFNIVMIVVALIILHAERKQKLNLPDARRAVEQQRMPNSMEQWVFRHKNGSAFVKVFGKILVQILGIVERNTHKKLLKNKVPLEKKKPHISLYRVYYCHELTESASIRTLFDSSCKVEAIWRLNLNELYWLNKCQRQTTSFLETKVFNHFCTFGISAKVHIPDSKVEFCQFYPHTKNTWVLRYWILANDFDKKKRNHLDAWNWQCDNEDNVC